jgi:hypothetical protein
MIILSIILSSTKVIYFWCLKKATFLPPLKDYVMQVTSKNKQARLHRKQVSVLQRKHSGKWKGNIWNGGNICKHILYIGLIFKIDRKLI